MTRTREENAADEAAQVARYRVSLNNSAGELDWRGCATETQAAEAAIEMIEEAGRLFDGDTITVTEIEGAV
jgi:hypothetical protein